MNTTNKPAVEEIINCIKPLYDPDSDSATIACVEEDLSRKVEQLQTQAHQNIKAQLMATHPDKLTEVIKNL